MEQRQHSSHWGAFKVNVEDERIVGVEPFEHDPHPSPIISSVPEAVHADNRVAQPSVRKSWLDAHRRGERATPGALPRGQDSFVTVSWEEALALVASELRRVRDEHGPKSIFGGSYGWSSAGRFHHAKGLLQRFLSLLGGFTNQTYSYSNAAGHAVLPYLFGEKGLGRGPFTSWDSIAEHTDLFVSFGGLGLKNTQVEPGGMGEHAAHKWLWKLKQGKTQFISITPVKDDSAEFLDAEWLTPRPNTDVAMMLGIAYTLWNEDLLDRAFLDSHCVGFEKFEAYLSGANDGVAKTAEWAQAICGLDADVIENLARLMASGRTMIGIAYALQRAEHGEQTYWMTTTLAAMLGQIGAPGGGCGFGYGSMHGYGNPVRRFAPPAMPSVPNPANSTIPVARITDLLLNPGAPYQFNGEDKHYPDTRLVYWCGGNPFHHHQDLNRLVEAWQRPETIIVNEIWWTATAKHADIVLPATSTLERNDIGTSSRDRFIIAMQQAVPPQGEARNDFDIFATLAEQLGFAERFTEGRDEQSWLRHMYDIARQQAADTPPGEPPFEMPDFDTFWSQGHVEFPEPKQPFVLFGEFHESPTTHPLKTPSGKVELYSETVAGYGYDDCPGHAVWLEPQEWLGGKRATDYPLHLISNQPQHKLHAQMDGAGVSRAAKVNDREVVTLHPDDAEARGIENNDLVRVFNDRGATLASARLSKGIRPSVVRLPTGAWFDPDEKSGLDKHGNPNVLTPDRGTSRLAQGPIAHSALVEVELYTDEAPSVTAFDLPPLDTAKTTANS